MSSVNIFDCFIAIYLVSHNIHICLIIAIYIGVTEYLWFFLIKNGMNVTFTFNC